MSIIDTVLTELLIGGTPKDIPGQACQRVEERGSDPAGPETPESAGPHAEGQRRDPH